MLGGLAEGREQLLSCVRNSEPRAIFPTGRCDQSTVRAESHPCQLREVPFESTPPRHRLEIPDVNLAVVARRRDSLGTWAEGETTDAVPVAEPSDELLLLEVEDLERAVRSGRRETMKTGRDSYSCCRHGGVRQELRLFEVREGPARDELVATLDDRQRAARARP